MLDRMKGGNPEERDQAGYMDLVVENLESGSKATRTYCSGASKISPLVYLDEEKIPCYYLIQLGGGYIEGEIYENSIDIREDSRVILTSQASNKVYKSENRLPSVQNNHISIGEGAVLEYRIDSLILYKDAVYRQNTDIYLRRSSTLIYSDGITSGWSPDGKMYQYHQVNLKTNIYMDGEIIYLDNLKLIPETCNMQGMGFLEGYKNFGTMIVYDERLKKNDLKEIHRLIEATGLDISFGISELEGNGFLIRVMGNLTQHIERAMDRAHNYLRRELLGSEELDMRKY